MSLDVSSIEELLDTVSRDVRHELKDLLFAHAELQNSYDELVIDHQHLQSAYDSMEDENE